MKQIKKELQTICLVLFCLIVCIVTTQKQSVTTMLPMASKNIVLDAGAWLGPRKNRKTGRK